MATAHVKAELTKQVPGFQVWVALFSTVGPPGMLSSGPEGDN